MATEPGQQDPRKSPRRSFQSPYIKLGLGLNRNWVGMIPSDLDGHSPDTALSYSTVHTQYKHTQTHTQHTQKSLNTLTLLLHTQIVPSTLTFSVHTGSWLRVLTSMHKQPEKIKLKSRRKPRLQYK